MTEETTTETSVEPIQLPDHGYEYVTTPQGLQEAVASLRGSPVLAVDVAGDSFFSYAESVCLLQLTGAEGPDWIIDPKAVEDLSPLAPLMADPDVVKIFHGADFDIVSIKRDYGFRVRNIFDTMLAAQASGHERFGLGDLVRLYFGDKLEKKYQRHDWSSRPLKPEHLSYARLDTHYLPTLREILTTQAEEAGRMEMLEEEFALLELREWTGRPFHADDFLRLRGARKLNETQQRVCRAVFELRDQLAHQRNRPAFKVWGNDVCLRVGEARPRTLEDLRTALGETHHVVRRYPRELLKAVERGLEDRRPIGEPWKASAPEWKATLPPFTRDDEPLFDALKPIPTLVVRGAISDILMASTVEKMRARKPDLIAVEVPDVGHAPFLTEPAAWEAVRSFLTTP